jgi:hypothetical protein
MSLETFLTCWVVSLVWFVVGSAVLAFIDDSLQSLYHWAKAAPFGLYVPIVMVWPLIAWLWLRRER